MTLKLSSMTGQMTGMLPATASRGQGTLQALERVGKLAKSVARCEVEARADTNGDNRQGAHGPSALFRRRRIRPRWLLHGALHCRVWKRLIDGWLFSFAARTSLQLRLRTPVR